MPSALAPCRIALVILHECDFYDYGLAIAKAATPLLPVRRGYGTLSSGLFAPQVALGRAGDLDKRLR